MGLEIAKAIRVVIPSTNSPYDFANICIFSIISLFLHILLLNYFIYYMHQYYKHFKGNIYKVLYIAKHSETLEDYVVYQAMYGQHGIWVRPKAMFEETITRDGQTFRRFSPISEEEALRCLACN